MNKNYRDGTESNRELQPVGWDVMRKELAVGTLYRLTDGHDGATCTFTPTEHFNAIKPFFDAAAKAFECGHKDEFNTQCEKIQQLNLRLRSFTGGYDIEHGNLYLMIDDDKAWMKYKY